MQRKVLLVILFLLFGAMLFAKPSSFDLFSKLQQLNNNGMQVLAAWAVINIAVCLPLSFAKTGKLKYFWQMNAAWNLVNLIIASIGILGGTKEWQTLSEFLIRVENYASAYLFNAGLDVGYIMTGLYLKELANRKEKYKIRLLGYGQSIIVQGAFLFLFDIVMFILNRNHFRINISPWLNSL